MVAVMVVMATMAQMCCSHLDILWWTVMKIFFICIIFLLQPCRLQLCTFASKNLNQSQLSSSPWFSPRSLTTIKTNGDLFHFEHLLASVFVGHKEVLNKAGILSSLSYFFSQWRTGSRFKEAYSPLVSGCCAFSQNFEIKTHIFGYYSSLLASTREQAQSYCLACGNRAKNSLSGTWGEGEPPAFHKKLASRG